MPAHKGPRPTHAIDVSRQNVSTRAAMSCGVGRGTDMQKQVDGSPDVVSMHGVVQLVSARVHVQSDAMHCDGIWQPVTMMPWSGTEMIEPHAPAAATIAAAVATARVQRMGRHLAVARGRKASPIAARLE